MFLVSRIGVPYSPRKGKIVFSFCYNLVYEEKSVCLNDTQKLPSWLRRRNVQHDPGSHEHFPPKGTIIYDEPSNKVP